MLINELVRSERRKNGLSQARIAEILGMSERTFRKYENREIEFNLKQILKLSRLFKNNPLVLIYDELEYLEQTNKARLPDVSGNGQITPFYLMELLDGLRYRVDKTSNQIEILTSKLIQQV